MPADLLDNTGHRGETEYEFNLLAEYLQVSEAAIPAAEEAAHAQLQNAVSAVEDDEELLFAVRQFMDQAGRYRREFPLRLRYGFLIQLYTLLEDRARSLCQVIANRDDLGQVQLRDQNRVGFIYVFREWIQGNTKGCSARWEYANSLRIIRNCLAHANGRIEGDRNPERLRETIEETEGVAEDEFGYIALNRGYCDVAYEQIRGLFDDIYATTRFGSPFFLAHRQPRDIGVIVDHSGESPAFEILGEAEET